MRAGDPKFHLAAMRSRVPGETKMQNKASSTYKKYVPQNLGMAKNINGMNEVGTAL